MERTLLEKKITLPNTTSIIKNLLLMLWLLIVGELDFILVKAKRDLLKMLGLITWNNVRGHGCVCWMCRVVNIHNRKHAIDEPFRHVSNQGTNQQVEALCNNAMNLLYIKKSQIIDDLRNYKCVISFNCNLWSKRNHKGYICTTIHFY